MILSIILSFSVLEFLRTWVSHFPLLTLQLVSMQVSFIPFLPEKVCTSRRSFPCLRHDPWRLTSFGDIAFNAWRQRLESICRNLFWRRDSVLKTGYSCKSLLWWPIYCMDTFSRFSSVRVPSSIRSCYVSSSSSQEKWQHTHTLYCDNEWLLKIQDTNFLVKWFSNGE